MQCLDHRLAAPVGAVPAAHRRHLPDPRASASPSGAATRRSLEEDIALTNMALDLVGQARAVLTHAGELEASSAARHDEDQLAFLRDERDFRNCTLVELPRGDFAVDGAAQPRRRGLLQAAVGAARERRATPSSPAIAGKAVKEARYHQRARGRLGRAPRRRHRRIGSAAARPALDAALALHRRDVRGRRGRRPRPPQPASARAGPTCATTGAPRSRAVLADAGLALPAERRLPQHRQARPCTASTWATCWPRCSTCSARSRAACGDDVASARAAATPARGARASSTPGRARRRARSRGAGVSVRRPRHRARRDRATATGSRSSSRRRTPAARRPRSSSRASSPRSTPPASARRAITHAARARLDDRLDQRRRAAPSCATTASRRPGRSIAARRRRRSASSPRAVAPLACPRCGSTQHRAPRRLRLDRLQGAVALPCLRRAVRALQADLTTRRGRSTSIRCASRACARDRRGRRRLLRRARPSSPSSSASRRAST